MVITILDSISGNVLDIKTSTEKAKGIWLCADHFSAQYRTKPLDPNAYGAANE
jgi:hypothetical protein